MEKGIQQFKEDSLLSNLSNVSYRGEPKHYNGNDFFNKSLPVGHSIKDENATKTIKSQQVDPNTLTAGYVGSPVNNMQFMVYNCWLTQNAEGNSDDGHLQQFKLEEGKEVKVKIQNEQEKEESEKQSKENQAIGTVIKNQTKNIPKNYGKAIITYIQKYQKKFQPILDQCGVQYQDLLYELSKKKKTINTIANLRDLWVDFKFARCMRILSNHFLRKQALQYIFNSRICNYTSHVKYRKRLEQAIETPYSFCHIKQY